MKTIPEMCSCTYEWNAARGTARRHRSSDCEVHGHHLYVQSAAEMRRRTQASNDPPTK